MDSVAHGSPCLRRLGEPLHHIVLDNDRVESERGEFNRSHSRKSFAAAQGARAFRRRGNGDYVRCDGILPVFVRYFISSKEDVLVLRNGAPDTWSRCILPSRLCANGPANKIFIEHQLNGLI